MSKSRGTDGSLLASLPWTMASLALALLPHVPYLPVWITGAFLGCATVRYAIETRRGSLPSTWFRAALALFCFLGVLATYDTISGVGPGSALLAVMASLKILETRKRRDQFVLLFIAIFLVMSSLLREQHLWSLPYLVVAMIFIMSAWLRMSSQPGEPIRRSFRTGCRLLLYAAPLAIAMWIFFPRISTPFWSVPIDTSSGVSGLSDTMSPGDISSLSLSNKVAFRVRFEGAVPAPRDRYWRAMVLHRFNGRSWSGGDSTRVTRPSNLVDVMGDPIRYQVTLEPTRQQWLPALEVPYRWDLSRTHMGTMQQLSRDFPIDQRIAYTIESYPEYRADANLSEYQRGWFLTLPEGSNPRTAELARQMRSEAGSVNEFITAILSRFHNEEFYYTLEPPALGANPVDRFLFDTRQGFCEHYASAFSVMMRSVGIPARVVVGYQGGELNPVGDYMIVRQSDAHAWTEVWLEGQGWTRVDPTAAVAPERIEMGVADSVFDGIGLEWGLSMPSQWLHRLQLSWDALNAGWNEWVLGYGPDKQESLMDRLGMEDPTWRKMMLTLIGIVIAMTIVISLVLMMRYRPPRRDRAAVLYQRFVDKCGVAPRTGEDPIAFAERAAGQSEIGKPAIDGITDDYLEARYGPLAEQALARLEQNVSAIR